jgi:hypothetical protein
LDTHWYGKYLKFARGLHDSISVSLLLDRLLSPLSPPEKKASIKPQLPISNKSLLKFLEILKSCGSNFVKEKNKSIASFFLLAGGQSPHMLTPLPLWRGSVASFSPM